MRRKMMTSLVALVLTLVVVFVSSSYIYCHSRDHLSYSETLTLALNSTAPQALHEASNHALAELPRDPRRRRSVPHEAVLLPDWEALVLVPSGANGGGGEEASCLFSNGAASPARFAGSVASSGRAAYRCVLPGGARRLRPFRSPRLVLPGGDGAGEEPSPEMLRWNRLAYESLSTPDDVVVFAKGVSTRSSAAAAEVRCVYYSAHGGGASASSSAAISAAQEVFRCPHPPPSLEIGAELRVSLATGAADATPIPSLASYRPPRAPRAHGSPEAPRSLICACTMVYNAAKFLGEWVAYHAAIGVERFFLYDNASDDDEEALAAAVRRLSSSGHRVSSRYWPWPKTQEAAFSHCAAAHRDACRWMAFVDVDEFLFSPDWAGSPRPNRSMLKCSLLPVRPNIGQVTVGCYEFGPSSLSAHPKPGVTQGYTCRRRAAERHKSVVRLDAIDRSLANSVHHFSLRKGFRTRRVGTVRVNHYKYQAWDEFKVKFRRRASAFVADWSTAVNPGSRDRTPGLGFKAIEPVGWTEMFCEVRDFKLRDATRRWFGAAGPDGTYKMAWE